MADQVTWTATDGSTIDLTDPASGYMVLAEGTRGLRAQTYEVAAVKYAGVDGEAVQSIRAAANAPTLGVLISANDAPTFRRRVRALRHAMRPKAGAGTLTVRTEDGQARSLDCYVVGGLEGDETAGVDGAWLRVALKLYAPQPWWYGDTRTATYGLSTPPTFFPITPMKLATSTVQGGLSVDLTDTDAPSYPVWTITGPGTALTLTNNTTGRVVQVNATLAAGETMVIDTRPGMQSVRKGDGTNLMGSLASDPALWPLVEGTVNSVTVALSGATSASAVSCTYQPRYGGID